MFIPLWLLAVIVVLAVMFGGLTAIVAIARKIDRHIRQTRY